jgi:cytochrome c-type biogenesis protein CcmH/NrfG
MKQSRNPLLLVLAAISVCAILYATWHAYQNSMVKEQSQAAFTAPTPSGIPDIIHATPGAPPIQPH